MESYVETGMMTTLRHHEAVKGVQAGLAKARTAKAGFRTGWCCRIFTMRCGSWIR